MTTLGIHYLTGRAVATDRTRSDGPEYPRYFGRVFMAMAATYFETRGDDQERAAQQWLESAPPPIIEAGEGFARSNVKTYVPVNDKLDGGAPPLLRSRQSRAFPTMRLHDPFVYLCWNVAVPDHLRGALDRLCAKVTRIGHSSLLVHMWLADDNRTAGDAWEPVSESGDLRMRIAEPGTPASTLRSLHWPFAKKMLHGASSLWSIGEWLSMRRIGGCAISGNNCAKPARACSTKWLRPSAPWRASAMTMNRSW